MNAVLDSDFLKNLKKVDVRLRKAFKERIQLFSKYPNDLQLNNHKLKDEYEGYMSIDITADYCAIYKEAQIGGETVAYFVELGTHDQLFRKRKLLSDS